MGYFFGTPFPVFIFILNSEPNLNIMFMSGWLGMGKNTSFKIVTKQYFPVRGCSKMTSTNQKMTLDDSGGVGGSAKDD